MMGLIPSVPVGAADVEVEVEEDTIVDVEVPTVDETDEEIGFDVDEDATVEDVDVARVDEDATVEDVEEGKEAVDVRYSSRRLPAPQYSRGLPPQTILQSAKGADELLLASVLPQ